MISTCFRRPPEIPDPTIHSEHSARLAATADGAVSLVIHQNHADLAVDGRADALRPDDGCELEGAEYTSSTNPVDGCRAHGHRSGHRLGHHVEYVMI